MFKICVYIYICEALHVHTYMRSVSLHAWPRAANAGDHVLHSGVQLEGMKSRALDVPCLPL